LDYISREELIYEIQQIEDAVWRYNDDFIAKFATADTEELMSLTFNSTHAKFLLRTRNNEFISSQTTMLLLFQWLDKFRQNPQRYTSSLRH
jgi:hypothetical protein